VLLAGEGREVVTLIEARRELSALHSNNLVFTEAQCRRANELIDIINEASMATRIGRATVKDGKVKPASSAPKTARIAAKKKVARTVKGLVKNRTATKARAAK
jgi:hypothetical protein